MRRKLRENKKEEREEGRANRKYERERRKDKGER